MTFNSSNLTISNTEVYIHQEANTILQKARVVSEKLGIIDEELYAGHSTMTNYLYIDSPISKMVNLLVTYDVFYFLDDFFGEDTNTGQLPDFAKILEIWKKGTIYHSDNTKIDKLYASINYISQRIKEDSPSFFFKKYTDAVIEHLHFSLTKKEYNTVDEYIEIRLMTGGMYPVIHLIEYAHSIYLDQEIMGNESLYIADLQRQCALIAVLSNDVFSYAKEKHSDYNLINAFLITGEAANYKEAVMKSIKIVNDVHADFKLTIKKARQNLKNVGLEQQTMIEKYIHGLDVIVASSYHWQKITNRYYHSENVFEDMKAVAA
jgi:hypothetical protein